MSTLLILLVVAAAAVVAAIVMTGRKAERKVEDDLSEQGDTAPAPDETAGRVETGVAGATPYMDQNQFADPEAAGRDEGLKPASENPGAGTPSDEKPASDADKV